MYRRQLLAGVVAAVAAGCTSDDGADTTPTATTAAIDSGAATSSPRATMTPPNNPTDDLDLREANVTAVDFDVDGRTFSLDVTLYHDDDGEDGYANWWQVETLDGENLGRRELLHAHGTQEFTRSAAIDVPADVSCVVVRGHDQTHGYGGQTMLVNLETGATSAKRQGEERATFTDSDCP